MDPNRTRFVRPMLLCLAILLPGQALAATFEAVLDGSQEVPAPTISLATGIASLSLDLNQTRLEMTLQLTGLDLDGLQTPGDPNDDVVGLHIHRAPFGVNGPVVFSLIAPPPVSDLNDLVIDPVAGTLFSAWDLTEGNNTTLAAELPNLLDDGLYFNVHTAAFPGGEIRGQITRVPEPTVVWLIGLGLACLGLATRLRRTDSGRDS